MDPSATGGCPMSRRRFLHTVGLGAAASGAVLAAGGPASALEVVTHPHAGGHHGSSATFGRMFPDLPPFAEPSDALVAALVDIARPGGLLDARDDLAAGPVALITDPKLSLVNRDNPTHTAGTTFMGQYLDHDITFDVGSRLGVPTEPTRATNGRTPRFDLDSLYGAGPVGSPQLYDPADPAKLRIESGGHFEDLPRQSDRSAIIADPRNDENLIIAGLQCAFIEFHNHAVDVARATRRRATHDTFGHAQRLTRWHYQWMILHEFLPLFVGPSLVEMLLRSGPRFFRPSAAHMPVEFQAAAYRMGHSMVRPSYRANLDGDAEGKPFFGFIFDPALEDSDDPDDLVGGARAPRRFIDWQTFFDFGDGQVKHNKRIDTHLSSPLFNLPLRAIASHDQPVVLAQRTLLRHITWSLPSGQAIARRMHETPLAAGDLSELAGYGLGLERSTPLWYYVLKEAEVVNDGLVLGPVGARIVGEVFVGLLLADHDSYLRARRHWTPTLPTRTGTVTGDFRMIDFLTFAGVDPTSRASQR
jgi:hypothetical protein